MSSDVADTPRYMGMTLRTLLENSDLLQMPVPRNFVKDGPKKEGNWDESFDATAAFLGPTLWDKTVPYSDEFKMEYMDLDEFLCDNGINVPPSSEMSGVDKHQHHHHHQRTLPMTTVPPAVLEKSLSSPTTPSPQPYQKPPVVVKQETPFDKIKSFCEGKSENGSSCKVQSNFWIKNEMKFSPADLALATGPGQEGFDPRAHAFSEDELKPQPMIKKSKKQFDKLTHEEKIRESCTSSKFVPEDLKDDKYWARRRKNNLAAKRSRDARRIKENQIALRASFLEKENNTLKKEVDNLRNENIALKEKLSKYEQC